MSINVTVTGNPVSIKRGKMVTADPHTTKKEFDKRRLLRLEQVRQQSKELAEDVRNKVRKEKKKQMGQIEQEGKEKLKNWQNRKLLELHNQYLNALDEMGLAHKEAEQLANESEILEEQRLHNEKIAKSRGRLAETKQQVQKNEENYKKSVPIQQKKIVRDIENTRAALVASMGPKESKKKCQAKKAKPVADINISIPNDSDFSEASTTSSSDSSKYASDGGMKNLEEQDSEGFCECSDSSDGKGHGLSPIAEETMQQEALSTNLTARQVPYGSPQKSYRETIEEHKKAIDNFRNRPREVPLDTRISDRIRQRQLAASQPDYCDLMVEEGNRDPLDLSSQECLCTKFHSACPCAPNKSTDIQRELGRGYRKSCECHQTSRPQKIKDIPSKPAVQLKDVGRAALSSTTAAASKARPPHDPTSQVDEKIQADSGLVPSKPGVKLKNVGQATRKVEASSTNTFGGSKVRRHDQSSQITSPSKDIPTKPRVKLKDVGQATRKMEDASTSTTAPPKVRHYNYPNRFERDLPSTSQVEKIQPDSIEVIPDSNSESDWHEKMRQRDLDAQARGKRALQKEKIQKDYQEMMKKLPVLQRKEHIARIGTDKPEFHMSEERLKERERERQNRLENAYSQAVPDLKPQIVTIPSRRHEIITNDEPFEILDGEDSRTLNLGKWDTDTKPKTMFSAEEVQEIIKAFTVQKPEDRKAKLKQLLRSLKLQKEQLINEIRALPKDDSINALISDLSSFSDNDLRPNKHQKRDKVERKRRREESDTSTEPSRNRTSKAKKSPHKKIKKPKVLILQNMSTQTTPKPSTKEKSSSTTTTTKSSTTSVQVPEGIKICTKSHTPCDCYNKEKGPESSQEVCKIFIKLNQEESPKVEVVRGKQGGIEKSKPIKTKSVATETEPPLPQQIQAEVKPNKSKQESWKEHFSKNSLSNSSTSYLSPPDFSRQNTTTGSTEQSKPSFYNLRSKPKQTNTIRSLPQLPTDQELLNYVKRLLSMSRNSIEDLGVSSSDVQTPSHSVIEIESNNPLAALHDMIKSINLRAADVSKELSASAGDVVVPPNSSANVSDQTTGQESSCNGKANELLSQYADVTDSCAQRIANLAAMIEQLRQEKIEMLQGSPLVQPGSRCDSPHCSDKEYSTKYMEFPPFDERSKGTNSTGSMDEEELNRRLLDIDMSLAEKLKRFRQEKNVDEGVEDQQFLERLQKLIQDSHDKEQQPKHPTANLDVPFVPFLIDIPKLPILEPEPEGGQVRRHPPPSKGLISAKKFNGEISLIPHELSTIIEAESQLSTKLSPNASKIRTSEEPTKGVKFSDKLDSSESLTCCTEGTCPNVATSSSSSKLSSSSSSSDLKSIEAMLKSIGMDWAIPTLHKTQEALALTSSSSSGSLSVKKKSVDKSTSASEVSLKDFLKRQMISKISSSSLNRSDASPASFMRECSDISAIQANSSAEKTKRRTSTPVLTSKSTSKSNDEQQQQQLFTGASDISSVKNNSSSSGKPTFRSLAGDEDSSLN